jgi:glycosyltransferase involved in cell wall biosynthesis
MERVIDNPKYMFFSYLPPDYSRTGVYLNSPAAESVNLDFVKITSGFVRSLIHIWKTVKETKNTVDVYVVNSPSHLIAFLLKTMTKKPIVLDAGWPLSDGIRFSNDRLIPRIKTYLIDLISFHSAKIVILESDRQIDFVNKKFLVHKTKLRKILTGFDERSYSLSPDSIPELKSVNTALPVVMFRGSWNPESGLNILEVASHELEKKSLNLIICTNAKEREFQFSKSTFFISRRLTNQEIRMMYEISDVVIGQISNNRRLNRTIPHKAFEAGYFSKPYISGDNQGVRELYPDPDHVVYLQETTPESLVNCISNLIDNETKMKHLGLNIKARYSEIASQETLGKEFYHLLAEQIRS